MSRRGRVSAVVAAVLRSVRSVPEARWRRHARVTRPRCRSQRPGGDRGIERPGRRPAAPDDARREAQPADAALRRADEGPPGGGAQAGRRRVQRDRSGADQQVPARRGRELAAAHPDPVRVRHDPRLPDGLPDPARRRRRASIPTVAFTDHKIGAFESAAVGIKQIYSPMVDVSHEPRWGRIVEAAGEDPYLNSVMAAARVKGAQGERLQRARQDVVTSRQALRRLRRSRRAGATTTRPTCPRQRLRNFYLPPFKAAIDAGADTVDVLVQRDQRRPGLREPVHRDRHPQGRVGLRRLHRERLHRGRRAARLPAA